VLFLVQPRRPVLDHVSAARGDDKEALTVVR
jgi:hypothetical protein